MTLAHTILAMVGSKIARVRCNTCGGDHAYRTEGGTSLSTRSSSPAAPRAPRPEKIVISFQDQLAGKDLSRARKYSIRDTYGVDEVINHPTFGMGIVTAVRHDKVEVAFKADSKTLIHARGEAPSAKPTFQPRAPASTGPADKPLPAEPTDEPPVE